MNSIIDFQSFEIDKNTSLTEIDYIYRLQGEYKHQAAETSIEYRKDKLKKLQKVFYAYKADFATAMYKDYNKPESEVELAEIFVMLHELKYALRNIHRWVKKQRVSTPWFLFGANSYIQYEAKGQALVISPWNFPIHLSLVPMFHSFAAGNTTIVKPSEFTPYTNIILQKVINEVFLPEEVSFIEGDASVAIHLTSLRFDHIFFTGSPAVGKKVMEAASKNLTSITLELGGKSPMIIDETADMNLVAKFGAATKFLNAGQYCIAPDYFLVHKSRLEEFYQKFKANIETAYGSTLESLTQGQYCHIINGKQAARIKSWIEDAKQKGAKVIFEYGQNQKELIGPILLSNVTEDMIISQEEIFGPIAYIMPFDKIDEAISIIRKKEKPLSMYLFSKNKTNQRKVLKNLSAGNFCINAVALNYYNLNLPFGGINHSGSGRSHGFYSFKEFSNAKAVFHQWNPWPAIFLMFPPFTETRKKIINLFVKFFR